MKRSRGLRQHPTTRSACSGVNASGNAVSALALSVRVRTIRNWPHSPASKPGGVNRSQRGSDNRSATACSITPGAEPQELAHRGERGVDRRSRTQPPASVRGCFDEMFETGQARQPDRGPLHPLVGAPCQEARHSSGIGTDRVGRTVGPVQRPQEVTGLPVHPNLASSTTHSSDPSRGDTARSALNDFIVPNVTAVPRSTGYSYGTGVSRR
jgi:hypothetical protein